MARVVKFPVTQEGRDLLRYVIRHAGGWGMPDGSAIDGEDFDEVAREGSAAYERAMSEGTNGTHQDS
jgi:hypothetical protein